MTHNPINLDVSRPQEQQQEPAPKPSKTAIGESAPMTAQEREQAWKRVYSTTHADFKGKYPDGSQAVMSWAKYGGGLASLANITDAELRERDPQACKAGA